MQSGDIQNVVVGFGFAAAGIVLFVVPPDRLPSWLQLETFARHRRLFALVAFGLGTLIAVSTLLVEPPKPYTPKNRRHPAAPAATERRADEPR